MSHQSAAPTNSSPSTLNRMPTIAALGDVEPPDRKLDGRGLVDVIKRDDAPRPNQTFHWQSGGGKQPQWAVRDGDWKLIGNPNDTSQKAPLTENDRRFLVNLSDDVTEMRNRAFEHPEVVERLEALHNEWLKDVATEAAP